MWISREKFYRQMLDEYHSGMRHGLKMGRAQAICEVAAKLRRRKDQFGESATAPDTPTKVVVIPTAGSSTHD